MRSRRIHTPALAAAAFAAAAANPSVELGTAGNYMILAKSGISTVPYSNINGDIGKSPGLLNMGSTMDRVQ